MPDQSDTTRSGGAISRAERARARWSAQDSGAARPAPPLPAGVPASPRRGRFNIHILILYVLVSGSLALNIILIQQLIQARDNAYAALAQVGGMVGQVGQQSFSIPIRIEKEFPVQTTVPFSYMHTFSISTTVPISDTMVVPFEVMGTTIKINVPVNMHVPVALDVPVTFEKNFEISTTVPISFSMDVNISLADTPLPAYLDDLQQIIQGLKFP